MFMSIQTEYPVDNRYRLYKIEKTEVFYERKIRVVVAGNIEGSGESKMTERNFRPQKAGVD